MSKLLPTTRTPSRAGRSPKHGKPANEATEVTTPASHVKPKRQQRRAIRRLVSPSVCVHACSGLSRPGPANGLGNSANPGTQREGTKTRRPAPQPATPPATDERDTLVTVPSGLILRVKARIFPATEAFFLAGTGAGDYLTRI